MNAHSNPPGLARREAGDSFVRGADASDGELDPDFRATLTEGQLLCERFRVQHLARRGGMGAIYRGTDESGGQAVAIKIVGSLGPSLRARFLRETQILADLSHPGIVRHLGHGATDDGTLFLVMEWLEGEDLSERLRRQPLSIDESLMLVRFVCQALEVAHARGIVHRDIKPANLFLTSSDPRSVKILDFGIARMAVSMPSLTTSGTLLGTVGYMAPEQAMGQSDVDARADVFALGCVLYECVTGRAPFASADQVAVLAKVLREEPLRPSEIQPAVDARVDQLAARMLAKKRDDRLPSAGAVLRELLRIDVEPAETVAVAGRSQIVRGRSEQRLVSVILGKADDPEKHPAFSDEETLRELSQRFSAEVSGLQGGALLVTLPGRGEANDRAAQAALCALELESRVPGLTLAVATGLAETSGRLPVGAAIERAAALLGAAQARGVYLDDATAGLVGLRFEIRRSGAVNLLIAARRELDAPRLLMGRPTPYLGRDRELMMLDGVLDECVQERVAHSVLVTGGPGMGKSRLASEWLARGGRSGALRALFARGDPNSAGSALSLVAQLLRDAAGLQAADPREVQVARLREHLADTGAGDDLEQIALFTSELAGLGADEPDPIVRAARGNPEVMREQMRRALHGWLDLETARQPVLVVLDDLHWGDASSVAFLGEALRSNPQRSLMVLALGRPEIERQFPELSERAALRIRLLGLSARAAQELVDSVLEDKPDDSVVARAIRTADGNPLYLEELIRRVASGRTDWPDTVLAMAQARIEQLGPESRLVLRVASVFGESCWDAGIESVVDAEIQVKARLAALVEDELLVVLPKSRYSGAREYRFRHALLRDATYATLTPEDRAASHGLAGLWLERSGEKDARLLADHAEAAGQAERARSLLARAAKAAVDAGDLVGTALLANRGVRLGASGFERGRFLLLHCYSAALRGEPEIEVTREALDLLAVGSAPWWLGLGVLIFGSCMRGRPHEVAAYVGLAADAPVERDPDVPLGQGMLTCVGGLVLLGKSHVAERILERTRGMPEQGPPDLVLDAFLEASWAALAAVAPVSGKWRLEQAYAGCRSSAQRLAELGALHGQATALYYFGVAAMHLGRYEEARDACLRSVELVRRTSGDINEGWPMLFLARAYLRLGEVDMALRAVTPIRALPDWMVQQMLPVILGEARLREGKFEAAEEEVIPACSGVSPRLGRMAASVLARALLAQGRVEDALASIERALELPTSHGLESEIDLLTVRGEALYASGRRAEALSAMRHAERAVYAIADGIEDAELRATFLTRVEPCARAIELSKRWADATR
jgi:tetratricopeptide (TPR) repeat protein